MRNFFFAIAVLLLSSCMENGSIQNQNLTIENASVALTKEKAIINTGRVTRELEFTTKGLRTTRFVSAENDFTPLSSNQFEDWTIPALNNEAPKLISATVEKNKSLGANKPYIDLVLEYEYTQANLGLKYTISAFPNADGVRTQIAIKKRTQGQAIDFEQAIFENLNLRTNDSIQAVGYFQNLTLTATEKAGILREENLSEESAKWANLIYAQYENGGLIVVKESPQAVDNDRYKTGLFELNNNNSIQINTDQWNTAQLTENYKPFWATWTILYTGQATEREYTLKQFDRKRFPINTQRDILVVSDMEGSFLKAPHKATYLQREENFANELKAARNMGIDLVHIDEGWQSNNTDSIYYPIDTVRYKGTNKLGEKFSSYIAHTDEWKKIRKDVDRFSLKSGLYTPGEMPFKNLRWNQLHGNFRWYRVHNYAEEGGADSLIAKHKKFTHFISEQGDFLGINYDIERNKGNVGYYFGREYGNLRLQSLAKDQSSGIASASWMLLRNLWYLAKYTNLNQYQIPFQSNMIYGEINKENQKDLFYPLAISFLGTPLFYQQMEGANPLTSKKVREFVGAYKVLRKDYYNGTLFPIGEEPSNKSWTGFQNYYPQSRRGYLTLFREPKNRKEKSTIALHGITEGRVKLTNILTGSSEMVRGNAKGEIEFEIPEAGDFRFFRYEKIDL